MVQEIRPFRTSRSIVHNAEEVDLDGSKEVRPLQLSRRINTRENPDVEIANGSDDPKDQSPDNRTTPDSSATSSVSDSEIDSSVSAENPETPVIEPPSLSESLAANVDAEKDQNSALDLPF